MPPLEASPPTPESQPAGDVIARLEYGQKLPLHKQHRVRRWIVPASLLLLIYVVLQQVPPIWHRIQLYRSQSECLKHPVSPGVLVYSSGPPIVAVAQTQFAQFFNLYKATQFSPPLSMMSTWHNQNLADLMLERWPVVPFSATVYIGRRQASNGLQRFIAVGAVVTPWANGLGTDVWFPVVNRPMGLADPAKDTRLPMKGSIGGYGFGWASPQLRPTPELVVYSATEDATDPSHFSFVYDLNCVHCIVDCWLQPDGELKARDLYQSWHIDVQRQKRTVLKAESPHEFPP